MLRSFDRDSIEGLICSYGWPCEEALAVARCESGLQPGVASPDGANLGLFQINVVHSARVGGDLQSLYDPAINTSVAYAIWLDQGWGPWSCKP